MRLKLERRESSVGCAHEDAEEDSPRRLHPHAEQLSLLQACGGAV